MQMKWEQRFSSGIVQYQLGSIKDLLPQCVGDKQVFVLTDESVFYHYEAHLAQFKIIVVPQGEDAKSWERVAQVCQQLAELGADRHSFLVGVGGGVITDLAGFVASVYMRGIAFGFVPTSLLAMVDAAIGGKNGVNLGAYKNFMGIVRQPEFILFDLELLKTLPTAEWSNGFAEIIKYACLFDDSLFGLLQRYSLAEMQADKELLLDVVTRCVRWKNQIVAADELENGDRKLLNFGHTLAHALEKKYVLPHGQSVAIGMVFAAYLSHKLGSFSLQNYQSLKELLIRYDLPICYDFETELVLEMMKMDKKKKDQKIEYVLLRELGSTFIHPLEVLSIQDFLMQWVNEN